MKQSILFKWFMSAVVVLSLIGCKSESANDDDQLQRNNAVVVNSLANALNQVSQQKNVPAPAKKAGS